VGLYDETGKMILQKTLPDAKASDAIPVVIEELLGTYEPSALFYTNGPGNQMSIKISYVCLKTLAVAKNIPLYATNSFCFNGFAPIELANKRFFCFENGNIAIKHMVDMDNAPFMLPDRLDETVFATESEPVYLLPPA